jgi:predicted RNA-binding Zn-ribbon protein involved in translation (DUF1610 family)
VLINLGVERIFAARLICGLVFVGFWYSVYRGVRSAGRLTMNRRRTASSICPRCGNADPTNASASGFRCAACGWEERR